MPKKPLIQMVGLGNIKVDHDLQSRCFMNDYYIEQFAESMADGVTFIALVLFFDGKFYWLADGFHRFAAASKVLSIKQIRCEVHEGTRRDAIIYSAGANKVFSVPRTTSDKKKAANMLFDDDEWFGKPAQEIAQHVGVKSIYIHQWRLQYCMRKGRKTLLIDRQKCGERTVRKGMTDAQVAEREKTAWDMSCNGATHESISRHLGITRRAVGTLLDRLRARHQEALDREVQKSLLPEAPDAPDGVPDRKLPEPTPDVPEPSDVAMDAPDGVPDRKLPEPTPDVPYDPNGSFDQVDPLFPLTSVLRMRVRQSNLGRLARECETARSTLSEFATGRSSLSLGIADKLAVRWHLKLVKETDTP